MPGRDGTGPWWVGCRQGGARGGAGPGMGMGRGPAGRGFRMCGRVRGGGFGFAGFGVAGECVCPQCGEKTPHQRGVPCLQQKCSKCGAAMVRA